MYLVHLSYPSLLSFPIFAVHMEQSLALLFGEIYFKLRLILKHVHIFFLNDYDDNDG